MDESNNFIIFIYNKMNYYICLILLFLLFICIFLCWYHYKKLEYYNETIVSFFQKNLNREPDVISSHYYDQLKKSQMEKELLIYKNQVERGKQYSKTLKICIVGLIRNSIHNISYLQSFYQKMKSNFLETTFIIVENDSNDNTRVELLKWANLDKSVIILCQSDEINKETCSITGFESIITENHPYPSRICRLSQLRNIYLDYIYKNYDTNDLQYLFVKDLDLSGDLYIDGLFHSMDCFSQNSHIQAIACNGLVPDTKYPFGMKYYDSFAYVELYENYQWDNSFDKQSHDEEILKFICQKYVNHMELDHVRSAFGGFCIYRYESLFRTKPMYECSKNNKLSCEHSHLNSKLKNVYVNPKMIYSIKNR